MDVRSPEPAAPVPVDLDAAADQAIAACGGDAREAVKAPLVANAFSSKSSTSSGARYRPATRGRLPATRDREE